MVFCFCSITTSGLRCCTAGESLLAESDWLIRNLIAHARCTFRKMYQIKCLVSGTVSWTYRISVIIIQCIFFRFELISPEICVTVSFTWIHISARCLWAAFSQLGVIILQKKKSHEGDTARWQQILTMWS